MALLRKVNFAMKLLARVFLGAFAGYLSLIFIIALTYSGNPGMIWQLFRYVRFDYLELDFFLSMPVVFGALAGAAWHSLKAD